MTAFPSYSTGTVAVANGATAIIGTGTTWSGTNVKPGDDIVIAGNTVKVMDVTDATHLVILPWPYTTVSAGASYTILKTSPLRFAGGDAMTSVNDIVAALNTDGFYVFVSPALSVPDPSYGEDNQFAFQPSTSKLWLKTGGVWVLQGVYKGFNITGAWSGATAYAIGDVVSLSGSSYVCILAHTNHTPPNATYWQLFASIGSTGSTGPAAWSVPAAWLTATAYVAGPPASVVVQGGESYVCLVSHTSGTFATDLAALKWIKVTQKGTGDLLASNNLSDLANAQTARGNLVIQCSPQGRLTLATGVPVMTTTQSAKTTIYYTPFVGNQIPLYDGTKFTPSVFSELSVATTDTTKNPAAIGASKVNDWFVWNDSGTLRLSHGPDWTTDTARSAGTALVMVNGILLNNASITNGPAASRGTYVGTTRSNASSQIDWIIGGSASGGVGAFLYVWNAYNRRAALGATTDSGTAYTYTSGTVRQARADVDNQVNLVVGLQEDRATCVYSYRSQTAAVSGAAMGMGIGFDSTSNYAAAQDVFANQAGNATSTGASKTYESQPAIGVHYFAALENSDGSSANTFDHGTSNSLTVSMPM